MSPLMMKRALLGIFGMLFFASFALGGQWLTNYDEALSKAKSEHKQLLMDFTGSDWCPWCMKLDREVFALPEFQNYADKKLVLLKVDFPRGKELPAAEKAQNAKLAEQFKIEGYPTVVVLNPNGAKAGELGYVEGGPKAFLGELQKNAPEK